METNNKTFGPNRKPNIKVPAGFELKFNYATNRWAMYPIKNTIVFKPETWIPKRNTDVRANVAESTSTKNGKLHKAKRDKNDEFYTRLEDIVAELRHYDKAYFRGKTIYLPCDKCCNVGRSNFVNFFTQVFLEWGIKKVVATQFVENGHGIKWTIEGDINGNGYIDESEIATEFLSGDGDFRSAECRAIMKSCDMVVTNPPFSLFREFVAQIMELGKKFLIIGNKNAITYKEIFPLIKENKIWLGYTSPSEFIQPETDEVKSMAGLTRWFTNLEHNKRKESIHLWKTYTEQSYPKYDNYDAIEVSRVENIPYDYDGIMGVPITFLDKYNPEQFEILGITENADYLIPLHIEGCEKYDRPYINGERKYSRLLIRRVSA